MSTEWRVGDRIQNRWEIHRIMRGGMGIVYVVYDHEWQQVLAAKTFQTEVFCSISSDCQPLYPGSPHLGQS